MNLDSNPVPHFVLLDTGSYDAWICTCDPPPTSPTSQTQSIRYVDGTEVTGTKTLRSVGLGSSVFNLPLISTHCTFHGQGVLGLAPNSAVMTFWKGQGIGWLFRSSVTDPQGNAKVTMCVGGIKRDRFRGPIGWQKTVSPSSWTFKSDWSVSGWKSDPLNLLIDTGSSYVVLPSPLARKLNSMFGFVDDPDSHGVFRKPCSDVLDPQQQITVQLHGDSPLELKWDQLYTQKREQAGASCVLVSTIQDMGTRSAAGIDGILGNAFLEKYIVVFDSIQMRVGWAVADRRLGGTGLCDAALDVTGTSDDPGLVGQEFPVSSFDIVYPDYMLLVLVAICW